MRALKADEIEVRVGQVFQKGVSLLLYKNARVDMAILDETYGEFGWQCDYKDVKGNMYCGISVLNEASGDWVWKWDCGTESNTEKEKGEASDAFKRAGFRWGIGRELYTAPFIWLNVATKPKANGKGYELNNPRELNGIFVSQIKTEEVNGKYKITALELSQRAQGKDMVIYQWKER
jgi:hypothetical protein